MAFLWLIHRGDPNHLLTGMILQVRGDISSKKVQVPNIGGALPSKAVLEVENLSDS